MKKKLVGILTAAALLSVTAAGIGTAYSYFTTYVEASGKQIIHLGDETTITEDFENWVKSVFITNKASSDQAVYVRVQAFAGAQWELNFIGNSEYWTEEDGYWVFSQPVVPGGSTLDPEATGTIDEDKKFRIEINNINTKEHPDAFESLNVTIIYETTPAVENGTDEEGKILYEAPDWDKGEVTEETVEGGENG